jgi:hypothetical protein
MGCQHQRPAPAPRQQVPPVLPQPAAAINQHAFQAAALEQTRKQGCHLCLCLRHRELTHLR